jgi:hypothetical protein
VVAVVDQEHLAVLAVLAVVHQALLETLRQQLQQPTQAVAVAVRVTTSVLVS